MIQADLFNEDEGRKGRDSGLAQVEEHADPAWGESALEAVRTTAKKLTEFTVDDVWPNMMGGETHDLRAMGPIMKRAQRLRLIEPTGGVVLARRVSCHKCPRRVWRSLIA